MSVSQTQFPFTTLAWPEVVAESTENISGISCHSKEPLSPLSTPASHSVHLLEALEVRGVAADPR